MLIRVPPGTIVRDLDGDFVMRDLTVAGEEFVAAHGGRGGKGNWRFKTSVNQTPRDFTLGGDGEHRRLHLELKVIADVGLVGKPNAGKSTLLSRVTRARPEIANYPFTTKFPNLGRVVVDIDQSFVMADIPGLIEGASEGIGLGHEFLRHIERAGILVHLLEPSPMDGTDPLENYEKIRNELVEYNPVLGERPELVAVTKAELPDARECRDRLQAAIGKPVLLISAVTGEGLNQLTSQIAKALANSESEQQPNSSEA
jgi:GTP-binding protein